MELDYKGKPIRALMVNGVPFMNLADILAACGYNRHAADNVHREDFPPFGKMEVPATTDQEISGRPEGRVFLSPTGIHYWSDSLDPRRTEHFTAWARREARRLCSNHNRDDPALYLHLVKDADGWTHVPPGPPSRYCGWRAEWYELKDGDMQAWRAAEAANAEWNRKVRQEREAPRLADEENGAVPKQLTLAEVLVPARAMLKRSAVASQAAFSRS